MPLTHRNSTLELSYWLAFLALLASMVFSWRAVSSIAILLILLISIGERIYRGTQGTPNDRKAEPSPLRYFLVACIIHYATLLSLELISGSPAWQQMQTKAAIVAIPLALYLSGFINKDSGPILFHAFAILLCIAFIYSLTWAAFDFGATGDRNEFFYHELVSHINGHAVYISVYCFVALVFLMESIRSRRWVIPIKYHALVTILLVLFLFLLSSRLIIAFFCIYLFIFAFLLFRRHRRRRQFVIFLLVLAVGNAVLLFTTDNPVKERYYDLKGKLGLTANNDPADYLNGFQFRLLQWKIVPQVLDERNAWPTGVGMLNAQAELNRKYEERDMYLGEDGKGGYQLYNTHNQFLQELLQSGVIGLVTFVLVCVSLIGMAVHQRSLLMWCTVLAVIIYAFFESLMETQYGTVIFCWLPCLAYLSLKGKN